MVDKTGMKIGRLTVVMKSPESTKKRTKWVCRCDCGNYTTVLGDNLKIGHTESCGCLWRERIKGNKFKYIHGLSKTRLHKIWSGMLERCYLASNQNFKNYGGRGITVCEEWHEFIKFYDWAIENGYSDDLSIDRINVNGNYEPSNCRWATHIQQSNNRRDNNYIEFNGIIHTEAEWSRIIGAKHQGAVKRRIKNGWSIEDAVTVKCGAIRNNQYTKRKRADNKLTIEKG